MQNRLDRLARDGVILFSTGETRMNCLSRTLSTVSTVCIIAVVLVFSCQTGQPALNQSVNTSPRTQTPETVTKTVTIILSEPNFAINGAYHELEEGLLTKAMVTDGVVMAPLSDIIISLGGKFEWSETAETVRASLGDKHFLMATSVRQVMVNDADKTYAVAADAAPLFRNGSLFLPVKSS
ncbi:MAG: hypothetical protein EHM28_13295, partial [Spirochaetaceae bacterium]